MNENDNQETRRLMALDGLLTEAEQTIMRTNAYMDGDQRYRSAAGAIDRLRKSIRKWATEKQ